MNLEVGSVQQPPAMFLSTSRLGSLPTSSHKPCFNLSPTCRYEDAYTNPGHPFACGITLDRISG